MVASKIYVAELFVWLFTVILGDISEEEGIKQMHPKLFQKKSRRARRYNLIPHINMCTG